MLFPGHVGSTRYHCRISRLSERFPKSTALRNERKKPSKAMPEKRVAPEVEETASGKTVLAGVVGP